MFLKDVVLARLLDDSTFSLLNSLIWSHQTDILEWFQFDTTYLTYVVQIITITDLPENEIIEACTERIHKALCFFLELSQISKSQHMQNKFAFYKNLAHHGLYSTFHYSLSNTLFSTMSIKNTSCHLLLNILENDP